MKRNRTNNSTRNLLIILFVLVLIIASTLIHHLTSKEEGHKTVAEPETTVSAEPLASSEPLLTSLYEVQPYAPIVPDNTSGFSSGWYTGATDGNVSGDFQYDNQIISIVYPGTAMDSISVYRDGIPYSSGSEYTITFTLSSSISRTVQIAAVNPETSEVLGSTTVNTSAEPASFSFSFNMKSSTVMNGRLQFSLGNDGSADILAEHTVTISRIRVIPSAWIEDVKTNQVSYFTDAEKRCTFSYDAGDVFDVINTETGETVYSGAIVNKAYIETTGETECYGDFTNVTAPGIYEIHSQIGTSSYAFSIGNDAYDTLNDSLLRMISLQRCGQDLNSSWAGSLAHKQCHTEEATIYGTDQKIDVSGGWHDAGDYGRYIKTAAKAVNDLLLSYMGNPNLYTDASQGPDSGNGTADILDEARYELEWMPKMQDSSDGGVYNKVLTTGIPGNIMPEDDAQELWVLEKETTATADYAGTMAIAALTWQNSDTEFADTCLNAAVSAYSYLKANPNLYDAANPDDVTGGAYIESNDTDGRFTAALALYVATGEDSYLADAKSYYASDSTAANGLYWNTNGGYGRYLYLVKCDSSEDPDFYSQMMNSLATEAGNALGVVNGNSYNSSLTSYTWGSNGNICDNGILLTMYYDLTGNQAYLQAAYQQLDYILGRNSLNMSFVSGYGTVSPTDVHSRIAKVKNVILPGALVGGPDSSRDDSVTQAMADTVPAAKMYSDVFDSYSTNEITIYWNSSMIYLISQVDPQ